MKPFMQFFIDHSIDITPYTIPMYRFNLAFFISYLVIPIRNWFFMNKTRPLTIFTELFTITFDPDSVSYHDIPIAWNRAYSYSSIYVGAFRNWIHSEFTDYFRRLRDSFNSMIIYDTSFLFVVILCGDEYIVINIDTFTFTLLSSMNALFEYLEMHLTSTFQMGSAYSLHYR